MVGLAGRARTPRCRLDRCRHRRARRLRLCRHLATRRNFGRILAAYGGIFVAGSLVWGRVVDGFRPDRFDLAGASICLIGVGVIMYAPR